MTNSAVQDTPFGKIKICEENSALKSVDFVGDDICTETVVSPLLNEAFSQLDEYLSGKRKVFDLPLAPDGTEFQQKVRAELLKIPYGRTRSYSETAKKSVVRKVHVRLGRQLTGILWR